MGQVCWSYLATIAPYPDRDHRQIEPILVGKPLRKLISALMHVIDINEVSDIDSNRRTDRRTEVSLWEPVSPVRGCFRG